uniref:ABC-F family ATP-binding cassette domain-containing protein n=1 Tax=Eubacterium cellulosolvens TaxID=29322 RepID=UPI000480FB26|nr:ABC-F family ATP-binding cassette domain-containing protein [[Eubacterium] cellulosolvens]
MNILNLENVSKAFVSRVLLDGVTVGISDTDKIGVIGVNGTGKSTLLAIAAGVLEPDEGQVVKGKSVRISYLSQNPVFDDEKSVLENVADAVNGKDAHWDISGEVRARLIDFGIPDPDCSPKTLSGGQKKRAALVAAILTPCELLILDEPTNHLDHGMIEWLQTYLQNYKGAILMVTHDRYFLDQVTNQILEIDRGKTYRYEENYSGYLEKKEERMNFALAAERKAAALYRKDLAWIQRGARARSTKQKAHIQRFEALRDREKIVEERQVELNSLASRLGGKTIELTDVQKQYGSRTLFHDFTYTFNKTDRIGIVGPNGCGKSTLMKIITGKIAPDAGHVEIGQTVRIGYFSQENEELDPTQRVIDCIRDTAEYIRTTDGVITASAMCEQFLFDGEMQYSRIEKLSGGEKRRLYLLKVLMEAPNVLILDEPTNDLDIQTLRILEDYLDRFAGIIITVSHDRYFLDRVVTRIFAFGEDGLLHQSEGGYTDLLEHAKAAGIEMNFGAVGAGINKKTGAVSGGNPEAVKNADADGKTGAERYAEQKQENKKKRKLSYKEQREYDHIEDEISELEEKSQALEAEMAECATQYTKLAELTKEKEEVDARLEERMERYFELQELVDQLNANG